MLCEILKRIFKPVNLFELPVTVPKTEPKLKQEVPKQEVPKQEVPKQEVPKQEVATNSPASAWAFPSFTTTPQIQEGKSMSVKDDLVLARKAAKVFREIHYIDSTRPDHCLCGPKIWRRGPDQILQLVKDGKVIEITCKECKTKVERWAEMGVVKIARVEKKEEKEKKGIGRTGRKKKKKLPLDDGIKDIKRLGPPP